MIGGCESKGRKVKVSLPGWRLSFFRLLSSVPSLFCHADWKEGTAILGLHSFDPITLPLIHEALDKRGTLECYSIIPWPIGLNQYVHVCRVTFAYVDDCRDAIKHFQKDTKFYLKLLDMDNGSSTPRFSNQGRYTRNRPHALSFSPSNGGTHPSRLSNWRGRGGSPARGGFAGRGAPPGRGGFSNYRNINRGYNRHQPDHQARRSFSNGSGSSFGHAEPLVHSSMSHAPYHDINPQFLPQPHPMPFVQLNGPAGFLHPHPQGLPPPPFPPTFNHCPLIVNGHPPYSAPIPPIPPFYGENFAPDNRFVNHPGGYFDPGFAPGFNGPYQEPYILPPPPPMGRHHPRHYHQPKPASTASKTPESSKSTREPDKEVTIEDLLERRTPEKRPELIRIHDSESDDASVLQIDSDSTAEGETERADDKGIITPKCDLENFTAQISQLEVSKKTPQVVEADIDNKTETNSPVLASTPFTDPGSPKKERKDDFKITEKHERKVDDQSAADESCSEQETQEIRTVVPSPQLSAHISHCSAVASKGSSNLNLPPPKCPGALTDSPLEKFRYYAQEAAVERGWDDNQAMIEEVALSLFAEQEMRKAKELQQCATAAQDEDQVKDSGKEEAELKPSGSRSGSLARSYSSKTT
ncbi:hypothetical protein N7470_004921 [Penicillium chermesinum]|nr:hypothetical protein N7470_004921 [Penicillium chermesinum]